MVSSQNDCRIFAQTGSATRAAGGLFSPPKAETRRETVELIKITKMVAKGKKSESASDDLNSLTEEERRALRGSRFAALPSLPQRTQPRLPHPGGPLATNKAAALAKFLERKLQEPRGLDSIDPTLVEMAVKNAKEAVNASGSSRTIRHVDSFGDPIEDLDETEPIIQDSAQGTKQKQNKKQKKKKKKLKQ